MKTVKTKTANSLTDPVWCAHCSIRVAPYDIRTVHNGKTYHRDCFAKANHGKGNARKN